MDKGGNDPFWVGVRAGMKNDFTEVHENENRDLKIPPQCLAHTLPYIFIIFGVRTGKD